MSIEGFDLESPSIIGAAVTAVVTSAGWLFSTIFKSQKEHREKIAALEVDLAKNYVPREEIESRFDRMEAAINKRFDRMEAAIDKVLYHLSK